MRFLFPLGLLGLIGVPIILIIYILRNKYNEQTVPSTYLWHLSEKFFKRRNPLSGLTGIISLILQILTVITISLAIAHPVFVIPNSASEYCFVLDASGSMNMQAENKTRFELAKKKIKKKILDARAGSTYTLILVSDETTSYERIADKDLAVETLADFECSDGIVEYTDALSTAQKYFDENPSFRVFLFTDKTYDEHTNVELINVSNPSDVNYALSEVLGSTVGNKLTVNANVTSYVSEAELTIELYVDDNATPSASTTVNVGANETVPVELETPVDTFASFRVVIANKDALPTDNEFISYNQYSEATYNILIVSETPFFLQAAFDAATDSEVDTVTPEEYDLSGAKKEYGLYVFHSYTPKTLPDAAVWLINSTQTVENSGFNMRGIVELDAPAKLEKTDSTATIAKKLLEGIEGKDISVKEYVKYSGMYTKFTTLFSYDSNPLLFAGVNALGNRQVVFAFDLHKAHFSLSIDKSLLIANLLAYSCPDALDRTDYICGEEVNVNITSNVKNLKAISPDGEEIYIDTSTDIGVLRLDKAGTYTITMIVSGEEKSYKLYSSAPAEESDPAPVGISFALVGEQKFEKTDGEYDPIVILFVCLALLFIADWMVYCYEKYQLR